MSGSSFVWEREDSTHALVQTWPTKYNAKFVEEFNPRNENFDTSMFNPQATEEFTRAMTNMFGEAAVQEIGFKYCHRANKNETPVYVGSSEALMEFLEHSPDVVEELGILRLGMDSDGREAPLTCVSQYIDGKGKTKKKVI